MKKKFIFISFLGVIILLGFNNCGEGFESQNQHSLNSLLSPNNQITINGNWSTWSAWALEDTCNESCTKTLTRSRTCTNPMPNALGKDCSLVDGGQPFDTKTEMCDNNEGLCKIDSQIVIDGNWTTWSIWKESQCNEKCIKTLERTRTCTNPEPKNGGKDCSSLDGGQASASKEEACDESLCRMNKTTPHIYSFNWNIQASTINFVEYNLSDPSKNQIYSSEKIKLPTNSSWALRFRFDYTYNANTNLFYITRGNNGIETVEKDSGEIKSFIPREEVTIDGTKLNFSPRYIQLGESKKYLYVDTIDYHFLKIDLSTKKIHRYPFMVPKCKYNQLVTKDETMLICFYENEIYKYNLLTNEETVVPFETEKIRSAIDVQALLSPTSSQLSQVAVTRDNKYAYLPSFRWYSSFSKINLENGKLTDVYIAKKEDNKDYSGINVHILTPQTGSRFFGYFGILLSDDEKSIYHQGWSGQLTIIDLEAKTFKLLPRINYPRQDIYNKLIK